MVAPGTGRPGNFTTRTSKQEQRIAGASTSVTGFIGIAERGPVSLAVPLRSFDDFKRVFGEPIEFESLYKSVEGFFDNEGAECYVSRLAHYTDPSNKSTITSAAAFKTLVGVTTDSAATYTGNVAVNQFAITDGLTLSLDIDNLGVLVATLDAKAASVTGAAGGFTSPCPANTSVDYIINGDGITRSVDISALTPAATAAGYASVLNPLMVGVQVDDNGGQLRFTSDRLGSSASIQFLNLGANWAAETGHAAGTFSSVGSNVANADAVTFAELKAVVEDEVKTAVAGDRVTLTQNALGYLVLTGSTGTVGAASEIDLTAGTLIATVGLSGLGSQGANPVVTGTAGAAVNTITIEAGYRSEDSPGLKGNDLQVDLAADPKFASKGAGNDLASDATAGDLQIIVTALKGIEAGTYLKLEEGAVTEYVQVLSRATTIVSGVVTHTVVLTAALANSFTAAAATIVSNEVTITVYDQGTFLEEWKQVSSNTAVVNYYGTMINDPFTGSRYIKTTDLAPTFPSNILVDSVGAQDLAGGTSETVGLVDADVLGSSSAKTGIYALDEVQELNLVAIPTSYGTSTFIKANSVINNSILDYCKTREDCFAIINTPLGLAPAAAETYRNDTLGADSEWGALYYPWIEVADPLGVANEKITIPPSGYIAGAFARSDNAPVPDGGVAATPAGDTAGKLEGVLGVEYPVSDTEHDSLNPLGINVIRNFTRAFNNQPPPGIVIYGGRTLSSDLNYQYIAASRTMIYIEQSVLDGTRWAVFKNNNTTLWNKVDSVISQFLNGMWRAEQLRGDSVDEAYFVTIDGSTTTQTDVDNGTMKGKIGVSLQKPAEFVIFEIFQTQNGPSTINRT
jgi:hypothetical protein